MFSSQGYLHFFTCETVLGTLIQHKNQFYAISQVFSKVKVHQNHLEGLLFIFKHFIPKKKNQTQRHAAKINLVLPYSIAFYPEARNLQVLTFIFFIFCASTTAFLCLPTQTSNKRQLAGIFSLSSRTLDDFQKQRSFPGGSVVRNPPTNAEDAGDSGLKTWVGKIPQRRIWQPTSAFLAGKFHGQRSLAAYSP